MRYCGHFLIKAEDGANNYECDHPLPLAWRPFTVVFVQQKGYYYFQNRIINSTREVAFRLSQTEEEMYCRQEKSYEGELVTQIFMILGYLNFSISGIPVV